MGMTIDEIEFALNSIKIVLEHTEKSYYPEQFKTHEECLKEVMDIVRKYQKMGEHMVAMLTDIQLEIEEKFNDIPFSYNHHQRTEFYRDIDEVIQEKINSLKEDSDVC